MSTIPQLAGFSSDVVPVINTPAPNMTRGFERFHISYNSSSAGYGCDTTALVLDDRVFFVLNGDHACDMTKAAAARGIDGCIDVFIDRIESASRHSEHKWLLVWQTMSSDWCRPRSLSSEKRTSSVFYLLWQETFRTFQRTVLIRINHSQPLLTHNFLRLVWNLKI